MSLAGFFTRVVATDASAEQIRAAEPHPRVEYRVARAEDSGLADASAELVTVAQALHWFDIDAFFGEAERVLAPGGLLAVWCYGFCRIDSACDAVVREVYEALADYWPPERAMIETEYRDVVLPLAPVDCPPFDMRLRWTVDELENYIRTWSAAKRYERATGQDAVRRFGAGLRRHWGGGERTVAWPLIVKAGRKAGRGGRRD